jgi:hypothetical protein
MELVNQYKDSEEGLVKTDGVTKYKLFLRFSQTLDICLSDDMVPGDLVFNVWDNGNYKTLDSKKYE